jgi:hypothetical protein
MTFKAGDKVYSYRFGIVELTTAYVHPHYLLKPLNAWCGPYGLDGKILPADKYPSIITLEEAEKRGFVKKSMPKHRFKYRDKVLNKYYISELPLTKKAAEDEMGKVLYEFVCFVDEKLNEISELGPFSWEEI